jgi:hypothetical protein
LGPVKYLATLLGAKDDDVLHYFILAVALLLDPAGVLLLLAATRRNETPARAGNRDPATDCNTRRGLTRMLWHRSPAI